MNKINCPNCNFEIPIDELLKKSIQEETKKELLEEKQKLTNQHNQETQILKKQLELITTQLEQNKNSLGDKIKQVQEATKLSLQKELEEKTKEKFDIQIKDLVAQLKEQQDKNNQSQTQHLELLKQIRLLKEKEENTEIELEKKLQEQTKTIQEKARQKAQEEWELKHLDKEKTIKDLQTQIEIMKQKAEQGSQQQQGEVLELEIENILKTNFLYDKIEEVKKGQHGADIKQIVCTQYGKKCGSILIEVKHAKNWTDQWISKLKEDQRQEGSEIALLVTSILPNEANEQTNDKFIMKNGVAIVHWKFLTPVITLLRNQLLEIAKTTASNEGRNDKKEIMYNYLTSPEFRHNIEGVVEPMVQMMQDLDKEFTAFKIRYNKRRKWIERSVMNLATTYGDMQGIIGSSMETIKHLDSDYEENKKQSQIEDKQSTLEDE